MNKQHILNEIRRTTLANGGIPLGKRRFFNETGIKESDWLGKFWPRWSAAIAEAGFTPLKRQGANNRTEALQKVVEMTRRLRKFPTIAEMRLERRIDSQFPNTSTLQRASSRTRLLNELLEYCEVHNDYDVEHILRTTSALVPTRPSDQVEQTVQSGTVYLILAGRHYKIGITTALYRRASQIANGHPNGAELVHSFETDDARGIEAYWHNRFSDKRIKGVNIASGEWFDLSKSDVAAFCKRKRFM
jgi:Meiotically up-regulated gene 113